ncbi:hypothetical protein SASPL_149096 [Salvia splendens]|uniref:Protein GLUTAMINE DUMPER n=1 Tax=Salvia splendens TaxID=180675 RepID=A0A8X8WAJ9_SALSN|nr:hypothetical protein SASPL_149096 [Salvia splendens]
MRIGFHSTTKAANFSPPAAIQRSPWHSPVPYLFGGMAAMLGLIAFALLILACSYWKLSAVEEGDVESGAGEKGDGASAEKALPVFEEKFLVIMAGEVNPTYLATARNASFGDEKTRLARRTLARYRHLSIADLRTPINPIGGLSYQIGAFIAISMSLPDGNPPRTATSLTDRIIATSLPDGNPPAHNN